MKKYCCYLIFFFFLFTAQAQQKLYRILNEYLPILPYEKHIDSLFSYYSLNENFTADSTSTAYLKGGLVNFNLPGIQLSKLIIEVVQLDENHFSYNVWECLDSTTTSQKKAQTEFEKLHKRINNLFAKNRFSESGKKNRLVSQVYNYYETNASEPSLIIGWGFNQSPEYTGYYLSIYMFLNTSE